MTRRFRTSIDRGSSESPTPTAFSSASFLVQIERKASACPDDGRE
jgi:hypothetical protein